MICPWARRRNAATTRWRRAAASDLLRQLRRAVTNLTWALPGTARTIDLRGADDVDPERDPSSLSLRFAGVLKPLHVHLAPGEWLVLPPHPGDGGSSVDRQLRRQDQDERFPFRVGGVVQRAHDHVGPSGDSHPVHEPIAAVEVPRERPRRLPPAVQSGGADPTRQAIVQIVEDPDRTRQRVPDPDIEVESVVRRFSGDDPDGCHFQGGAPR
jgi:hypothetical protein